MRKAVIMLITLLTVIFFVAGACGSPEPTTTPAQTQEPAATTTTTTTPPPTTTAPVTTPPTTPPTTFPTTEPTKEPTTEPTTEPVTIIFRLTDPTDDLFDKNGMPIDDEGYLDITEVEISYDEVEYVMVMTVNGTVPEETPDSDLFLEWDIYFDVDSDFGTGNTWPLVTNDIGAEGFIRVMLIDMYCIGEAREFATDNTYPVEYDINDDVITLRFPRFSQSATFDFVIAIKKFGDRGDSDALILADKAPNTGHYTFPPEK